MPNLSRKLTIPKKTYDVYSTQYKRKQMSKDCFLLVKDDKRLFPFKDEKGNVSKELLKAAIVTGVKYGYSEVVTKAQELLSLGEEVKKDIPFQMIQKTADNEIREIFGIVAVPNEKDVDGDEYTEEAVKDACYVYNKDFYNIAYRHSIRIVADEAWLAESYIMPFDAEIEGTKIKKGTWCQRWFIKDKGLIKQIDKGIIKGFSLGGYILDSINT